MVPLICHTQTSRKAWLKLRHGDIRKISKNCSYQLENIKNLSKKIIESKKTTKILEDPLQYRKKNLKSSCHTETQQNQSENTKLLPATKKTLK